MTTATAKPKPKRKSKFEPGNFAVRVGRSSAGLGLFAMEPIPKGACVIEYVGRQISKEEEYTSNSKYLFEASKKKTIDGAARSNTARYINHSCLPNCEADTYKSRVYIMARKNIRPGEELAYDYGKDYFDEHIKPKGCRCVKCVSAQKNSRPKTAAR